LSKQFRLGRLKTLAILAKVFLCTLDKTGILEYTLKLVPEKLKEEEALL
jgi:hypothetical protein